jgi:hypothetical protein
MTAAVHGVTFRGARFNEWTGIRHDRIPVRVMASDGRHA